MTDFAKLFTHPTLGQILMMLTESDEGNPSVRVTTKPSIKGIGLCTTTIEFNNTPEGIVACERSFTNMTMEAVYAIAEFHTQDAESITGEH